MKSEKTPASSEGFENIHERLRSLIRNISGKYDLEVTSTLPPTMRMEMLSEGMNPDTTWMRVVERNRKTGEPGREYVYVPKNITEATESIALGKAAHEASHAAISRPESLVEETPDGLVGFGALEAALEERPTDQYVRVNYPGAGRWLDEARRDSALEPVRHKVDFAARKEKLPLFAQLSELIVYEPTLEEGEVGERCHQAVIEVYKKIKANVEILENTIPDESDSEESRLMAARERLRIAKERIYPEAIELLEIDKQTSEEQELLNEIKQNPEFVLPPELAELLEKIKEMLETSSGDMDAEGDEKDSDDDEAGTADSAEVKKHTDAADVTESTESTEGEEMRPGIGEEPGTPSVADLPPEVKAALAQILENLAEDIKSEIERRARESLKKIEKEIIDEAKSELSEEHQSTEESDISEEKEPIERPRPKLEDLRERIALAEAEMEARFAASGEATTRFDEVYQNVREQEQFLYRRLEDIFYPNVKSKVKLTVSGSTISIPALFRYESTKDANPSAVDMRIFERRTIPEVKDYAFTLLVDLSGSMLGENIEEAFKATVMLAETLNRIGIKNEILGFQDRLIVFKEADQQLDNQVRKRIAGMEAEVTGRNPGGHNNPNYNDDGPCLVEASARLSGLSAREKFLVVISDGEPCGRRSDKDDLRDAVHHITTHTDQHLVGLGLGYGTDHVESFYPKSIANIEASDFADTLAELMVSLMEQRST